MQHEKLVFRQFALPVSTFDYLKDFQREHEAKQGVRINNNEVITLICKQHQSLTTVESEEQHEYNQYPN